jgi:hypothetical protein
VAFGTSTSILAAGRVCGDFFLFFRFTFRSPSLSELEEGNKFTSPKKSLMMNLMMKMNLLPDASLIQQSCEARHYIFGVALTIVVSSFPSVALAVPY